MTSSLASITAKMTESINFLCILHVVLECTYHHKYVKSTIAQNFFNSLIILSITETSPIIFEVMPPSTDNNIGRLRSIFYLGKGYHNSFYKQPSHSYMLFLNNFLQNEFEISNDLVSKNNVQRQIQTPVKVLNSKCIC